MKIRFNFQLQSRADPTFDPWLQEIFNNIEDNGILDYTLRVLKEKVSRYLYYRIDNKKNKTYAIISKQKRTISVEVYQKQLPDPNKYIKPPYLQVISGKEENTVEGRMNIANYVLSILDTENEYSKGEVIKTKVCVSCGTVDNNTLIGGRISDIYFSNGTNATVIIDNGMSFNLPCIEVSEKEALVNRFIVLDKDMNFDIVRSSEFDHYFQLI
jgi:hypothetical protein